MLALTRDFDRTTPWDVIGLQEVATPEGHEEGVQELTPGGHLIATTRRQTGGWPVAIILNRRWKNCVRHWTLQHSRNASVTLQLRTGTSLTDCTTLQFTTAHLPSTMNHDAEELDGTLQTLAETQRGKRTIRMVGLDATVDMTRNYNGDDDHTNDDTTATTTTTTRTSTRARRPLPSSHERTTQPRTTMTQATGVEPTTRPEEGRRRRIGTAIRQAMETVRESLRGMTLDMTPTTQAGWKTCHACLTPDTGPSDATTTHSTPDTGPSAVAAATTTTHSTPDTEPSALAAAATTIVHPPPDTEPSAIVPSHRAPHPLTTPAQRPSQAAPEQRPGLLPAHTLTTPTRHPVQLAPRPRPEPLPAYPSGGGRDADIDPHGNGHDDDHMRRTTNRCETGTASVGVDYHNRHTWEGHIFGHKTRRVLDYMFTDTRSAGRTSTLR